MKRFEIGPVHFTLAAAAWVFAACCSPSRAERVNVDGVGVTEWEEWSFASKDWWAEVAGDQTRTQFSLGSGKIAVADPDEWDDLGNPAALYTYNTQLLSPVINVGGAASLSLQFASSWRPEAFQKASLDVIYDGVTTEVFRWDSVEGPAFKPDAQNELVTVALPSPAGAAKLRLAFNLFDAGNNWWWAIDNVDLSSGGARIFFEDFESVALGSPIDEAASVDPVFSQDGPSGWQVVTEGYVPPAQLRTQPPHGPSITRIVPPQEPPLKLQVDPSTGRAQLVSLADELVVLTSYDVTSDAGSLAASAWQQSNLAARGVDAAGPGSGERWEVVLADDRLVFEAYLLGGTAIAPGGSLSLGRLLDPLAPVQDLDIDFTAIFSDRFGRYVRQSTDAKSNLGDDVFLPVVVQYAALPGAPGDFDGDGNVDGFDLLLWQRQGGSPADFAAWQAAFGTSSAAAGAAAIPEPATGWTAVALVACSVLRRRRAGGPTRPRAARGNA